MMQYHNVFKNLVIKSIFFGWSFVSKTFWWSKHIFPRYKPRNSCDERWKKPDREISRKTKEKFRLGVTEESDFSSSVNGQLNQFFHLRWLSPSIMKDEEKDFFADIKAAGNDVCEGFVFLCRIFAAFVI